MKTNFLLTKTFSFEAAHQLKYHDGKCSRLHGHSFKLTVVVEGCDLQPKSWNKKVGDDYELTLNPKQNMLLDYGDISEVVKPLIESHLDHHFLNQTLYCESPTSEFIAQFCFVHFFGLFKQKEVELREIRISETCTSEAIYRQI